MQKINYKEKILLEQKINELLIINIDDKLTQAKERDCIKVTGEIKVSGEVATENGNQNFYHPIEVDIMLSEDQLISKEVIISIDDFNYKIDDNLIEIELMMKVEGLKEIEPYFPAQEDKEIIQIEREEDNIESTIFENPIEEVNEQTIQEENTYIEDSIETELVTNDIEIQKEINQRNFNKPDNEKKQNSNNKKKKHSLLDQVFKNRNIEKETCYIYHVVKKETSYNEVAQFYNIDEEQLKKANNNEEIFEGKLLLIPKI